MQSNTYFKKVYNDLKKAELKKFAKTNAPMSFADLKILEYWVRIIDENPEQGQRLSVDGACLPRKNRKRLY